MIDMVAGTPREARPDGSGAGTRTRGRLASCTIQ